MGVRMVVRMGRHVETRIYVHVNSGSFNGNLEDIVIFKYLKVYYMSEELDLPCDQLILGII